MYYAISTSLSLTVIFILVLKPLAEYVGLVDEPSFRKHHAGVVPLVGGVAIYAALVLATAAFPALQTRSGLGLIALCLPIMAAGVADDRWEVSFKLRMALEILCCVAAAKWFDVRLLSFGELLPGVGVSLAWAGLPLTIVGIVGVMNAFNMKDGVDGLSGTLGCMTFLALAVLASGTHPSVSQLLACIAGALFAFLLFNSRFFGRQKAAIFMGDAGTMLLGFALGWHLVQLSQGRGAAFQPVTALWIFAIPLMDTAAVTIRRVRRGQSPFHPDRGHLHHLLQSMDFGVRGTVLVISIIHGSCIILAFAFRGFHIPQWVSFWLFLVMFAIYYAVTYRFSGNSVDVSQDTWQEYGTT